MTAVKEVVYLKRTESSCGDAGLGSDQETKEAADRNAREIVRLLTMQNLKEICKYMGHYLPIISLRKNIQRIFLKKSLIFLKFKITNKSSLSILYKYPKDNENNVNISFSGFVGGKYPSSLYLNNSVCKLFL